MPDPRPFDPAAHLTKVTGRDYLEVKWRLVWLRSDHPNATIDTEILSYDPEKAHAHVKATITLPDTGARATAHKQEDAKGFRDYLEKAETGAVGRALAMLGYGTQFAPEFDGDTIANPVDSPIPSIRKEVLPKDELDTARSALFAQAAAVGISDRQIKLWATDKGYTSRKLIPLGRLRSLRNDFTDPTKVAIFKEKYPDPGPLDKDDVATLTPA
jgi:hypothetical protein